MSTARTVWSASSCAVTAPGRICFIRTSDCDSVTYDVRTTSHVAASATLAFPSLGLLDLAAGLSAGYGTTGGPEGFPLRTLLIARLLAADGGVDAHVVVLVRDRAVRRCEQRQCDQDRRHAIQDSTRSPSSTL